MTQSNLAMVFPGQGSQKIGLLAELAESFDTVQSTFAEASDVLGYDLWDLGQNGSQEDINLTERTQPLLLTASVAVWRVWCAQNGAAPAYLAGHSLGNGPHWCAPVWWILQPRLSWCSSAASSCRRRCQRGRAPWRRL